MTRVFILMMDSFGIGGAPDAAKFNDEGSDTFGHIADTFPKLKIPNLVKLGLVKAANFASQSDRQLSSEGAQLNIPSCYGHSIEKSMAKDTSSGHWEVAGVPIQTPWGYFKPEYPSFPQELVNKICSRAKLSGILGNKAASGTEIIKELGEEHIRTGLPICYTSVDSCFQVAAHEKFFGLQNLYDFCQIAFEEIKPYNIARVIARPFEGENTNNFYRTKNRHDYSVTPPKPTLLDIIKESGREVIGIGKISDIYAGCGISKKILASGLEELWNKTIAEAKSAKDQSLIFTNFVDFDMVYGHRRNTEGYAQALEYFDSRLPEFANNMQKDDIVFIVADHGNDPSFKGTDHTREQIPILMFGHSLTPRYIGQRETFADIGQTVADIFGLKLEHGTSFYKE